MNGKANHAPTGADVRAIVIARRDEEDIDRELADKVRDVVAQFEGKQIGKRLKDRVAVALGETGDTWEGRALVHLQKENYGSWTLFVWSGGTGRNSQNRLMFFIPSEGKRMANGWSLWEGFEKDNPAFFAGNDERQALRNKALNPLPSEWRDCELFAAAVTRYHLARQELIDLVASNKPLSPDEFVLVKAFDLGKLY